MTNNQAICSTDFQLIAPPHTPFYPNGTLNLSPVAQQAEWFAHTTVNGVFVAGSTGEGLSLTVDERKALAERWVEVAPGHGLKTFIQIGHNSQPDAIRLAKHAREIGADAIAINAPCYFKPENVDRLIDFIEPVSAAAHDLPIYFYDIPSLTGVRLSMVDFLARGKERLPNLVGIKYTNPDMVQLQECLHFDDRAYELFFGTDEALLAACALGIRGAIGSTYNFMAPFYRQLITDIERGDWEAAREKQLQSISLCKLFQGTSFIAASKCVMKMLGMDLGPVRSPLRNLSDEEQSRLVEDLEAFDVFSAKLDQSRLAI